MEKRLFTSESVTEGHPDKICDQISDAILDALLEQDPMSRVACETCTTTGYVMVLGEITSKAHVDFQQIIRDTVREIGYDRAKYGFDADTCAVVIALDKQSPDIAMGVDKALEAKESNMSDEEIDAIGAGDQGMMFGYASNETEEFMPYPIALAHKLARQLTKVRKDGTLSYLRPDGKTQVTVEYDENGKPIRLDAVVLSTQHDPDVTQEQIHADIKKYVFDAILPAEMVDENTKFFINPTGRFVIGGPHGDAGLTGRKIIVDSYGGYARHGGGAFSGKDCTKVDRSAAYAARYVAKNIVAAGLADTAFLRDRRSTPDLHHDRQLRYRKTFRQRTDRNRTRKLRPPSGRNHQNAGFAPSDLQTDRRIRTLRTQRPGSAMGKTGQGRRTEKIFEQIKIEGLLLRRKAENKCNCRSH